jgi:hypothetical protein
MLVEAARHWSVYKQIFSDHWEEFQRAHPRYQTAYYDGLVAKMLGCGDPDGSSPLCFRIFAFKSTG